MGGTGRDGERRGMSARTGSGEVYDMRAADPTVNPAADASAAQRRAADPSRSVWVGASAGSGKTKVLTDRVLRLLLPEEGADGSIRPGTPPHRILCLTFTKAAAREMALRLNRRL